MSSMGIDIRSLRPKGASISKAFNGSTVKGAAAFADIYSLLQYGKLTMPKINWVDVQGVSVSQVERETYTQEIIKRLRANPEMGITYTLMGDMMILGTIDEYGNITIEDLTPGRWAYITAPPGQQKVKKCSCDLKLIIKSGCKCGGA